MARRVAHSTDTVEQIFARKEQGAGYGDIARALGIPRPTVVSIYQRGRDAALAVATPSQRRTEATPAPARGSTPERKDELRTEYGSNSGSVESVASSRITTLEALLDAADVDQSVWEVERFVINKWEVGAVDRESGEIKTAMLFQVKAWLKRKAANLLALEQIADRMLARVEQVAAARATRAAPATLKRGTPRSADPIMLEISPFDLHVGKLAWAPETGHGHYDSDHAEKVFKNAIEDILQRASSNPIEKIIMPIGNDLLQADNLADTTTSGTPQDTDGRHMRSFDRAWEINVWALERLSEVAPVEGIIIPGNHDRLSILHMGRVLSAWFRKDKWVSIDSDLRLRKYHRYGINLLGFTHGNEEKHTDLPLLMAKEVPELFAQTLHHEWHLGHLHKSKSTSWKDGDEFLGTRVRILPSLCGADAWHVMKGYMSRRACEAYLWGRETGFAGMLSSNVLPERKRAA